MATPSDENTKTILKAMALEIMEEMEKGKDISSILNRDKILELINKVKEKDADYYLCHLDLQGTNEEKVKHFDTKQNMIYKSLIKELKDKIDFDVEFYKIGQSCNGLRKRNAAVFKGAFFSTKLPTSQFNKEKAKDKTAFLVGCSVQEQTYAWYKNNVKDARGEWSNPEKPFRLVIEYNNPRINKKEVGFFYLYFENESRMKEVEEMLFGLRVDNNTKEQIRSSLNSMQQNLEKSFFLYGMLKLLGVKSSVQKRKELLHDFKEEVSKSIVAIKKEGKEKLKKGLLEKYKKKAGPDANYLHYNSEIYLDGKGREQMKSRATANRNRSSIPNNEFTLTTSYNNSEMFPMITGLPYSKKEDENQMPNEIKNKENEVALMKDKLKNIGIELSNLPPKENHFEIVSGNDGRMFEFEPYDNPGVNIKKDGLYKGTLPNESIANQSKGMVINKKNNEIIIGNSDDIQTDNTVFTSQNIYDISNVFLDSNFDVNDIEQNRMVILGPKKDPNKHFSYKYKDDKSIDTFVDPEQMGLKFNNGTRIKAKRNDLVCVQIFHAIIQMPQDELYNIIYKTNLGSSKIISDGQITKQLLFYYTLTIQSNKSITGELKQANVYKDNTFIIEFNNLYVFERGAVFGENIPTQEVKVDLYVVPTGSFPPNCKEAQKRTLIKFLGPYLIGSTSINAETIEDRIMEYPINKPGINKDQDSKLLINTIEPEIEDTLNITPTLGFMGWDYSIGSDTYLVEEVDVNAFNILKKNPYLTHEIIQQCYDVASKDDTNEILFRAPENMTHQEFIASAQDKGIEAKNIKKIIYNNRFKFLPVCETYTKKNKFSSYNLQGISDEEKSLMEHVHKEGDWIYKAEALKLRMLSKNLGVSNNKEILQLNYFSHARCRKPLTDEITNQDMYPIANNSFNIFDMNELETSQLENFDNYQWKCSFKFKNKNAQQVALKNLIQLRQQANLLNDKNFKSEGIDYNLLLKSLNNEQDNQEGVIKLQVDLIEFHTDEHLSQNAELELIVSKGKSTSKNKGGKSLIENLELDYYDYKNSLLQIPAVKKELESIKKMNMDDIIFEKKPIIKADKFNNNGKVLKFKDMGINIPFQKKSPVEYDIICKFNNINDKTTISKYVANINRNTIRQQRADILVIPLYKVDDNSQTNSIKGILTMKAWDSQQEKLTFDEALLEDESKVQLMKSFAFSDSQSFPLPKGRNEPNILRRKFLCNVYNKFGKSLKTMINNIKQNNNSQSDKLYNYIEQKCIEHPNITNPSQLKNFDYNNVKLNVSNTDLRSNTYLKKRYKKFLRNKNRKAFFENYNKIEWNRFLPSDHKEDNFADQDDDNLSSRLQENKDKILSSSRSLLNLRQLLCNGYPKEIRVDAWEMFLDIEKLRELTEHELKNINKDSSTANLSSKEDIYMYFHDEVNNNAKTNIIFSLIDNDTNYITLMKRDINDYEYIDNIKTIAKAFFKWTDLNIHLNKDTNKKYVYFQGILSIIQRLRYYFGSDAQTFWFIIGFSQFFELFQQDNPLYNDEMSYINVYVLVTKMILEKHFPNIYNKFYELNFPIEQFISKHLNCLYSEYFNSDLLFPFYDILIFEAYNSKDKLKYLRILCATPVTLFQMNEKKILQAQTVSELETVFDDFIIKTFDSNKFIQEIMLNLDKFFLKGTSTFLGWFEQTDNKQWDQKRDDIQRLMYNHFSSIQEENINYLQKLTENLNLKESERFSKTYFEQIDMNLKRMREIYGYGTPNDLPYGFSCLGIYIHVNRIIPMNTFDKTKSLPDNFMMYILPLNSKFEFNTTDYAGEYKHNVNYSYNNQTILNQEQLFFDIPIPSAEVKYINIILVDNSNIPLYSFSYDTSKCEIMRAEKITLESNERSKCMIEFTYMKYSNQKLNKENKELYDIIFGPPVYYHNIEIENKYASLEPNNAKTFNNEIKSMIQKENAIKDKIISNQNSFNGNESIKEIFTEQNKQYEGFDEYINKRKELYKEGNMSFKEMISEIIGESKENGNNSKTELIIKWLKEKKISFEEILYSMILTDKSSYTISEKMNMLFTVAQMKNKFLFNSDYVTIDKVKELFYALYKRYMIYFTKSEIDRMIDFAIKDEKLLNIKYVLAYPGNNAEVIKEFIYDINRYPQRQIPKHNNTTTDITYYVNLTKQLNVYLNYLINHFNVGNIKCSIIKAAINDIINNDKELLNEMRTQKCTELIITFENDNVNLKKLFSLDLQSNPIKIEELNPISLKQQSSNNMIDDYLQNEYINNKIIDTYGFTKEISYDKFKRIFFNLPFISDLLRVSCIFIKEDKEGIAGEFDYLKLGFYLEDKNLATYHFPSSPYELSRNEYNSNKKIKKSDTVKDLIDKIKTVIKENTKAASVTTQVNQILNFIDNINLHECKVIKQDKTEERLFYFESLYSSVYLKNNKRAEMQIKFKPTEMTLMENDLFYKVEGFGKVFYDSNLNNYKWNKCKINPHKKEIQFKVFDLPAKLRAKDGDYFEDIMGEGRSNFNS